MPTAADARAERFDGMLLQIASNTDGIEELLDVMLGFLRRKTDAFTPPGGFPQLRDTFVAVLQKQYDTAQAAKAAKAASSFASAAAKKATAAPKPVAALPRTAPDADIPVLEKGAGRAFDISSVPEAQGASTSDSADKPAPLVETTAPAASAPSAAAPARAVKITEIGRFEAGGTSISGGSNASSEDGGNSTGACGLASPTPGGNGGATSRYTWSQTLSETTIVFPLPASVRKTDLSVDIKAAMLRVAVKGAPAPLLDGPLAKRVKTDDSYWTLGKAALTAQNRCSFTWALCYRAV